MNKKKLLALLMALVMTLTLVPVTAFADSTPDDAVARVGETYYTNLQKAISDAFNGGTVEVLKDVTVQYWHQNIWSYYEGGKLDLSTDAPDYVRNPLVGPNGLTINGNGHTVTIKNIDSGTNGDSIFARAENTTINNITFDNQATVAGDQTGKYGIGMKSGALNGVTIKTVHGAPLSIYCNCANTSDYSNVPGVTVTDCVLDAGDGKPIYTWENSPDYANLIVRNSTLRSTLEGTILILRSNDVIENCKIDSPSGSKITLTNDGIGVPATITGNDFGVAGLKVYSTNHAAEATITRNVFSGTSVIKRDGNATVNLSGNYWGGSEPSFSEDMNVTYNNWYTGTQARESAPGAEREVTNLVSSAAANVAQIVGGEQYETLADAINAAKNGDTVKLLQNVTNGGGVQVSGNGNRTIIIDLGGHTYTVYNKAVGSTGTETQGFQLLKGSNITIKNGTIDLDESAYENGVKRLFNVYCNLTLDGVTVDVSNLPKDYQDYAVNFTNGDSSFINGTKVIADEGTYPVSVAWWPDGSYTDGAHLNVGAGTEVEGIYFACFDPPYAPSGANATATGWNSTLTVNGSVERVGADGLDSMQEKDAILHDKITSADASASLPAGYEWKQEGDVYRINKTYVAQIGTTKYATLQEAFDVGGEVTLLRNVVLSAPAVVKKTVKLDMANHTINNVEDIWAGSNWSLISVQAGGDLTVTGNGTVSAKAGDCYAFDVRDGGKLTTENGTFVGNLSAVYVINQSGSGVSELNVNGGAFSIIQLSDGDTAAKQHRYTLNCYDASNRNGTAKITVKGGTFLHYDPSSSNSENPLANFVADGYEAVALSGEQSGWYQVGKVKTTTLTEQSTDSTTGAVTYQASKSIVDTEDENEVLSSAATVIVKVTPTKSEDETTDKAAASVDNIKNMSDFVATVTSKTGDATEVNVTIQVAKSGAEPVANTITYEVHPEAIISVTGQQDTTVALTNDQIQGSFTFKLNVPTDVAAANGKVTVTHKHADGKTENLGTFTVANDNTITLTGISSFSEFVLQGTDTNAVNVTTLGASLRRRVRTDDHTQVVNTSTDFRMTYLWTLPDGVNLDTTEGACYFLWSKDNGETWKKVNITDVSGNTASIVITGVPKVAFGTTIKSKIHLEYTGSVAGEIEVSGYDRSVTYVATELAKRGDNDMWGAYGKHLLSTNSTYTIGGNGFIFSE